MKKYYKFTSSNKVNKVHVVMWIPKGAPKAIVQISHGMIEHIERYSDFAEFLCERGILVVGNDHLGHGRTALGPDDYGYFGSGDGSRHVTQDLHTITVNVKKMYGDTPIFLLGHSMGSFIARRYLMTYGKDIAGAIIMGTGNQPLPVLVAGKTVVSLSSLLHGDHYRSKFVERMFFGMYNKRIDKPKTESDWLTREDTEVNKYRKDPMCSFKFTNNGYSVLLNTLLYIVDMDNMARIPSRMPVLLTSGREDPVGDYGKGVLTVYDMFKTVGLDDVSIKLYEGCRHELINERNRETVYEDIYSWIEDRL